MSKLSKEIEKSKEETKQDVPLNAEVLSDIVEAELDNIAGGGFDEVGVSHGANIAAKNSA
jgi:hypothetical protein